MFNHNSIIRLKQENRQPALCGASISCPFQVAPGWRARHGDLCNTFRGPDGGVGGDRSSRNLPEQSAASRCRLIVSEKRR